MHNLQVQVRRIKILINNKVKILGRDFQLRRGLLNYLKTLKNQSR